jgi:hypothetical protein
MFILTRQSKSSETLPFVPFSWPFTSCAYPLYPLSILLALLRIPLFRVLLCSLLSFMRFFLSTLTIMKFSTKNFSIFNPEISCFTSGLWFTFQKPLLIMTWFASSKLISQNASILYAHSTLINQIQKIYPTISQKNRFKVTWKSIWKRLWKGLLHKVTSSDVFSFITEKKMIQKSSISWDKMMFMKRLKSLESQKILKGTQMSLWNTSRWKKLKSKLFPKWSFTSIITIISSLTLTRKPSVWKRQRKL